MTEIEPWPSELGLLVRYSTNAQRIVSTVGGNTPSRRTTTIPIGTPVMVVEDYGLGTLVVAWNRQRYQVFRGDLMEAPDLKTVAYNASEVKRLANELRLLRQEHDRVLQEKQDLVARLERMTDANGRNLWRADEAERRLELIKDALTVELDD